MTEFAAVCDRGNNGTELQLSFLRHLPIAALLLACSCSEDDGAPANSSTGATGGTAGVGGSSAGSGGSGGAKPKCLADGTHIDVVLNPNPIGHVDQDWSTVGAVTSASKNEFTVDTCAPNSGCTPALQKVTIKAPGLDAVLPLGAFVRLHVVTDVYNNNSLETTFSVQNVPTWKGQTNPASTTERWYLLTSEQSLEHPDAPFKVSSRALQCASQSEGGSGQLHEVVFTDPGGSSTKLAHDQPATLMLGGQSWDVQVLRAFQRYGLDRPDPFSWYAESIE